MLTRNALRSTPLARGYAVSVVPAKVFPDRAVPRLYPDKKAMLYHRYTRILNTSSSSTLIFLSHKDFTSNRLVKLRKDIIIAAGHPAPSLAKATPVVDPLPSLTILRTSVFGAALRDFMQHSPESATQLASMATTGPLAVLSLPSLSPPQLSAVLRIMDRTVPKKKPKTKEEIDKELQEKLADPVSPGRRMKRVKPERQPELVLAGALVEGRVFTPEGLGAVSKLPKLDTLRAQVVGLLSSPGMQIAAILAEASGGKLARTLEGLKKGLEEGEAEVQSP